MLTAIDSEAGLLDFSYCHLSVFVSKHKTTQAWPHALSYDRTVSKYRSATHKRESVLRRGTTTQDWEEWAFIKHSYYMAATDYTLEFTL